MSVALEYDKDGYSPVATQNFFRDYWKPGIEALKLIWLPTIEAGFSFKKEDIPELKEELKKFLEWTKANQEDEIFTFIEERINLLNEHFEKIDWDLNQTIFIG